MDVYLQVLEFRVPVLRRMEITRVTVSCMRCCSPAIAIAAAIAQCLLPPAAQKPRKLYQNQVIKEILDSPFCRYCSCRTAQRCKARCVCSLHHYPPSYRASLPRATFCPGPCQCSSCTLRDQHSGLAAESLSVRAARRLCARQHPQFHQRKRMRRRLGTSRSECRSMESVRMVSVRRVRVEVVTLVEDRKWVVTRC
jgi:hypothetical protein